MLKLLIFLFFLNFTLFPQGVGIGKRYDITTNLKLNQGTTGQFAQIFIPDYFSAPTDGNYTLVFHLHSASWAAENEVYRGGVNAVLFNIHLGGLSSPYQNYFTDQNKFQTILDTINAILIRNNLIQNPQVKNLIITSFSAGYAGVREILKNSTYYEKADVLILADGLHSSSDAYTMNTQLSNFLKFARDAAAGKKIFLLTHSSITTSGYQSTTQTSNYLIDSLRTKRISLSAFDEIGTQYSKCDTGYFNLKGYYGNTGDDHMKHLYAMHIMVKKASDILSGISDYSESGVFPGLYKLYQNYPNPFNPETTISFSLPETAFVRLEVYTITGEKAATLINEERSSGEHKIKFNASDMASGVYIYKMTAGLFTENKKMVIIK